MMRNKIITLVTFIVVSISVVGLLSGEAHSSELITELKAKQLVLQKYRQLYGDVYFLNPVDKKYIKFPLLDISHFDYIKKTQCCWIVEGEPPAGVYVTAKVSLNGEWVVLTSAGFAAH